MIILVNPLAAKWRYRIPLSILSIGSAIEGIYPYEIVDGNLDKSIKNTLHRLIEERNIRYVGFTVMPGPQLYQAIQLSKSIKKRFPTVKIIWGGYFSSLHKTVTLQADYVDFVIRSQGDYSFLQLIRTLESGGSLESIKGLSYKNEAIRHNPDQELIDPNTLTPLPYHKVNISRYIGKTYLGTKTVNYHSSVGCPFLCGFCAVAAVYQARWMGLTPERITNDLLWFRDNYQINAVEFVDNNFFTSEHRTHEFADRINGKGITWWGEARPDTLLQYADSTLKLMKQSGSKMIFLGVESSSQKVLRFMNKGGTQTPDTALALADKMRGIGIIPEFSFVLGTPSDTVEEDLEQDLQYIRQLKQINPECEIVIYVCSPVFFEAAELYQAASAFGFAYPSKLDDWLLPHWQRHDLRKNPVTPWLKDRLRIRIKNFERVLNAYFPTKSDLKLTTMQHRILHFLGSWRYRLSLYDFAYEVALIQKLVRYRQPEIEGF
ncbi:MAG TPA: radical SAM protein [Bacteroidota bacterium]|nr:radical SAM protein [Bacteroidota bacterium]